MRFSSCHSSCIISNGDLYTAKVNDHGCLTDRGRLQRIWHWQIPLPLHLSYPLPFSPFLLSFSFSPSLLVRSPFLPFVGAPMAASRALRALTILHFTVSFRSIYFLPQPPEDTSIYVLLSLTVGAQLLLCLRSGTVTVGHINRSFYLYVTYSISFLAFP